jgi:hypothetical protein
MKLLVDSKLSNKWDLAIAAISGAAIIKSIQLRFFFPVRCFSISYTHYPGIL